MIDGTVLTWCEAIEHGKSWYQGADTWRLREAFKTIAATFNQWPTPKQFLEALPPRKPVAHEQPALMIESDDEKAASLARYEESRERVRALIAQTARDLRIDLTKKPVNRAQPEVEAPLLVGESGHLDPGKVKAYWDSIGGVDANAD